MPRATSGLARRWWPRKRNPTRPLTTPSAEERDAVRAAIAALPERQRLALFLRYYADLDYAAIAAALGVRRGTVSATLNHAHESLRAALGEEVLT